MVRYVRLDGQISNIYPMWVYYTFITDPTIPLPKKPNKDVKPMSASGKKLIYSNMNTVAT